MTFGPSSPGSKPSSANNRTGARKRPAFESDTPLRILIAEDNEDSGASLKMLLDAVGYEAHLVSDGSAAVVAAAAIQPDVIIMDIGLPVLNGYEATRRIRTQNPSPTLRIIALTGWGKLEDLKLAAQAGIDHHFLKPLDFPGLRALLDSFMPESKTARRRQTEEPRERHPHRG